MDLRFKAAEVFEPLLSPARFKGAYGGRGSGKSHFFADMMVATCLSEPGTRAVCIREVQKSLKESSKRLIEDKIKTREAGSKFNILKDAIETPGGGVIIFNGMQDHTAESIKSLEGFKYAWLEEAQTISERSLALLRPTIRVRDSQIWASWNPRRKTDAVDNFFRKLKPDGAVTVCANWKDNPFWWTDCAELEKERQTDLKSYPERYQHIWEGDYARALEGAYYARQLAEARGAGRIGKIAADPILPIRAVFDLGGSGATADAMAIWVCQFVAKEIRVLDYIEGQGQVLAYYVNLLRERGWSKAICVTPHDGVNENNITGKRYFEHLKDAGFTADEPIPNQGRGAAMMRVEAARRLFPQIWFNDTPAVQSGIDALGFYHEKRHEERGVGLGPEHDWSSHAADAFGLMCVVYEEPQQKRKATGSRGPSFWG